MTGINVNESFAPYANEITLGLKTIETRKTPSLRPYIGKRVAIISTGSKKHTAHVVGYATISEEKLYETIADFDADFEKHKIEAHSPYDFDGEAYGYVLTDSVYESRWIPVETKGIVSREVPDEIMWDLEVCA